jgi:hypothetical protein
MHPHEIPVQDHFPFAADIGKGDKPIEGIAELRPVIFLYSPLPVADKVPVAFVTIIINADHIHVFQFGDRMIETVWHGETDEHVFGGSFPYPCQAEGKYKMHDVAGMVGYSLLTNFSRDFHKQFGMSPSQYIASLKNLRS